MVENPFPVYILQATISNSYLLYRYFGKNEMNHKEFLIMIIEHLYHFIDFYL